jgi:hypothetical protein
MKSILEFAGNHQVIFGISLCIVVVFVYSIISRVIDFITIWKQGYPPYYCDASGDQYEEAEEDHSQEYIPSHPNRK